MNDMSMKIPSEVVERAVRDKINSAIAEQLGDPVVLINKLVASALSQKVSSQGTLSRSSYDNKFEFLDVVASNFIREATHEALREYFEENKKAIKDAVKKEVAKSPSKMAKVFMDGITNGMKSVYSSHISISFENSDN